MGESLGSTVPCRDPLSNSADRARPGCQICADVRVDGRRWATNPIRYDDEHSASGRPGLRAGSPVLSGYLGVGGVAALCATLRTTGANPAMRVLWNQVLEWPTSAMRAAVESKGLTISPAVIQWEAVWSNVMEGQPLTTSAVDCLMRLIKEPWE